jgi:hypothetical protein
MKMLSNNHDLGAGPAPASAGLSGTMTSVPEGWMADAAEGRLRTRTSSSAESGFFMGPPCE